MTLASIPGCTLCRDHVRKTDEDPPHINMRYGGKETRSYVTVRYYNCVSCGLAWTKETGRSGRGWISTLRLPGGR